jgi:hypothetical protein
MFAEMPLDNRTVNNSAVLTAMSGVIRPIGNIAAGKTT